MLHFIGLIATTGPLPETRSLEAAARRLGGPDFGPVEVWRRDDCAFAWRRLPLRAATAEAPVPVRLRDGRALLIGSGRIDEQAELIAALALDRHRRWSDTELMAAACERWGEAAADRLRGDFSFALWDQKARRLMLARDTFGSVPLFHHRGDGFVAFGTNPAALIATGLVPRDLDEATLGEALTGRSVDAEATIYRGLRRVRRASTLGFDPTGVRANLYWQPRRGPPLRLKDDRAYVEATREQLARVMRGHLRGDRPIGVMLSGGLDSGALASTLAMLAPEREILGFTTVPMPGDPVRLRDAAREWAHVQRLAAMHPNLRVRAIAEKTATPIDDALRDVFADIGMPSPGLGLMTRRLALAEAARAEGVGTLLRGDGGNRTLTAEGEDIFHFLARSGRWVALAHEVVANARYRGQSVTRVLWRRVLRDLVPRPWLAAWRGARGVAAPPVHVESFLRPEFAEASGLAAKWRASPHNLEQAGLRQTAEIDPLFLTAQPAHAEAASLMFNRLGLECLAPLRDRRIVDFCLSLPADQYCRNGVTRFLARRVLADRMPEEALAERGYFEPFPDGAQWLAGWWDEAARRLADQSPADLAAHAIDLDRLRATLAEGPPQDLPLGAANLHEIGAALPNALHVNHFIRWHRGLND